MPAANRIPADFCLHLINNTRVPPLSLHRPRAPSDTTTLSGWPACCTWDRLLFFFCSFDASVCVPKLMLAPWFSVAQRLTSTAEPRPWDYLINLSGDSFPVLTPEPLRRTLHANGRHLNYVTCSTSVREEPAPTPAYSLSLYRRQQPTTIHSKLPPFFSACIGAFGAPVCPP